MSAPGADSDPETRQSLGDEASLRFDEALMRDLVRDLNRPKASLFWIDLCIACAVGWGAFGASVALRPFSPAMLACVVIAAFSLYRALCFLHEISHQNHRTLPGFETAWNFLVGYPVLMPSFVYAGVHQSHHRLSTYGTSQDPEYLPFARNSRMTAVFALESFFIPAVLLVRFLLLTPTGLVSRRFENWLVVHLSSLTMNVQYRRDASAQLVAKIRRHSAVIFIMWASVAGLALYGVLPWRFFGVWFVVVGLASFVNTIRTLGAHAYESSGEPLDRVGQLLDSIDTPGALWTELWAPVGLRYHALHHYFPGIPYHNLAEAYRRLTSTLPVADNYSLMSSPSLQHSLRTLYKKGLRAWN